MHFPKLSEFNFCDSVLRVLGIPQNYAHTIFVSETYETLIMLCCNFYTKEISHIRNVILDIRDKDYPVIFANGIPFIKECMYRPYEPTFEETSSKFFSSVNFNSSSEFLVCNCENLIRVYYYDIKKEWLFSSSKKIDDCDGCVTSLDCDVNTFLLNKNCVYTYNIGDHDPELLSVFTRCGDYLRKLPMHFFKSTITINIENSSELIEKINANQSILYFNPKIKGYIKFVKTQHFQEDEQLSYLTSKYEKKEVVLNQKIERDLEWLPLYILKCYQRKSCNKNLKFNAEEYFLIKKIQGSKNLLQSIVEELKTSTPKQLNNLINSMYLYAESCIS